LWETDGPPQLREAWWWWMWQLSCTLAAAVTDSWVWSVERGGSVGDAYGCPMTPISYANIAGVAEQSPGLHSLLRAVQKTLVVEVGTAWGLDGVWESSCTQSHGRPALAWQGDGPSIAPPKEAAADHPTPSFTACSLNPY
jgi:hypothetical protein